MVDISIIIPVFNEEKTVIDLLKKVNKQKSGDYFLEIIVINDGSSDDSKKLLTNNKDLYSKFINLEKNLGKGGAVIEGLKVARGEFILFQDADLEYNPEDYKKFIAHLLKNNLNLKAFNLCAHEAGATEDEKVKFTETLAETKEDPNSLTYTIKLNDAALDIIRSYSI